MIPVHITMMMMKMLKKLLVKYFGQFLVEALREKAKDTKTTIDDQLVDMVEKAIEGKDYKQMVESTKKEIDRAKDKVKTVKKAVKGK